MGNNNKLKCENNVEKKQLRYQQILKNELFSGSHQGQNKPEKWVVAQNQKRPDRDTEKTFKITK